MQAAQASAARASTTPRAPSHSPASLLPQNAAGVNVESGTCEKRVQESSRVSLIHSSQSLRCAAFWSEERKQMAVGVAKIGRPHRTRHIMWFLGELDAAGEQRAVRAVNVIDGENHFGRPSH